jgi:hypothetical protein
MAHFNGLSFSFNTLLKELVRMTRRICRIVGCSIAVLFAISLVFYLAQIHKINLEYDRVYNPKGDVALRKFPFPYKAAFTISNDIDKTETAEEFLEIQEFLNTTNKTRMGNGIGLEIGNSFFMYPPLQEFGYFSNRLVDRKVIAKFIEAGYIDTIHSWGDRYGGRDDARKAIEELDDRSIRLNVWVNHAQNKSDMGRFYSALYLGDNKESMYYHSDLTIPYGIQFAWLGSSTWIIGQATPISITALVSGFDNEHPLKSLVNVTKSVLKNFAGIVGIMPDRYALHARNDFVKPVVLDDGQRIYQFMRYDHHYNGIGRGTTSRTMAYNLSKSILDHLITVHGYAMLYSHLGKNQDCDEAIDEGTQKALRYLAEKYYNGELYVTTQAKMLRYYINHRYLIWEYEAKDDAIYINIEGIEDPVFGRQVPGRDDLQGITFYVPDGRIVRIMVNMKEIPEIIHNPIDETGRHSVSIPMTFLKYPDTRELQDLLMEK